MYLKLYFVIYIGKQFHFYSFQKLISDTQKRQILCIRRKDVISGLSFFWDVHMELTQIYMHPPEPDPLLSVWTS